MSNYIIKGETLKNIADAIRTKKGTSALIAVEDFANEILSILPGGNEPENTILGMRRFNETLTFPDDLGGEDGLVWENVEGSFTWYNIGAKVVVGSDPNPVTIDISFKSIGFTESEMGTGYVKFFYFNETTGNVTLNGQPQDNGALFIYDDYNNKGWCYSLFPLEYVALPLINITKCDNPEAEAWLLANTESITLYKFNDTIDENGDFEYYERVEDIPEEDFKNGMKVKNISFGEDGDFITLPEAFFYPTIVSNSFCIYLCCEYAGEKISQPIYISIPGGNPGFVMEPLSFEIIDYGKYRSWFETNITNVFVPGFYKFNDTINIDGYPHMSEEDLGLSMEDVAITVKIDSNQFFIFPILATEDGKPDYYQLIVMKFIDPESDGEAIYNGTNTEIDTNNLSGAVFEIVNPGVFSKWIESNATQQ